MCRPNGLVFDKKSLNMGPIFDPQIPKHGSIFHQNLKSQKFSGLATRAQKNFQKIPKHGSIFWAKSLNMGTFFTSKHGLGSRCPGGTPPSKPKSSTPPAPNAWIKQNKFRKISSCIPFSNDVTFFSNKHKKREKILPEKEFHFDFDASRTSSRKFPPLPPTKSDCSVMSWHIGHEIRACVASFSQRIQPIDYTKKFFSVPDYSKWFCAWKFWTTLNSIVPHCKNYCCNPAQVLWVATYSLYWWSRRHF